MSTTPERQSRRARKRAAKRQRDLDLLVARAVLAMHYNGEVPEHLRRLNLPDTLRAVSEVEQVRAFEKMVARRPASPLPRLFSVPAFSPVGYTCAANPST